MMNNRRMIWLALFALLISLLSNTALAESDGQTTYRALLIGIDSYENGAVDGARTDVNRMASLLGTANEAGGRYLTPATRTNLNGADLRGQLTDMLGWNVDSDDVTFVYYAGLGAIQNETDATIIMVDGEAVRLKEIRGALDQLPGAKVLVFDFRYLPNSKDTKRTPTQQAGLFNRAVINAFSGSMTDRDYQIISSTTIAESAQAASGVLGLPCGSFTYYLTQACGYNYDNQTQTQLMADTNQNGAISLAEARDYTLSGLSRLSRDAGIEVQNDIVVSPAEGSYPVYSQRATTETLSVVLEPKTLSLAAGTTARLAASVLPVNTQQRSVFWVSSDVGVCTVDQNGFVTAVRPGSANIVGVSTNGMTDTCKVMVRDVIFAESVSINATRLVIGTGQTQKLHITVKPLDSNELITWRSSDSSVATVDQSGSVTLIRNGSAIITATTESGKEVSCAVVSVDPNSVVTSVAVSNGSMSLYENEAKMISAKVKPATAVDQSVRWSSSDDTIAKVEPNGLVAGMQAGECIVTCTASSGITAEVMVKVNSVGIEVQDKYLSLKPGKEGKIGYQLKPKSAEAVVTWESSNQEIATVDQKGAVTAIANGETLVTVSLANGQKATCRLSVASVPIKGIKLNKTKQALDGGATYQLKYKYQPADATLTNLRWTSSNENILLVDEKGLVTAVGTGKATITARSHNGKGAKCEFNVKAPKLKRVAFEGEGREFILGTDAEYQLNVITEPETPLGNRAVKWTSGNTNVATVDSSGLVTIHGEGTATIRATSDKREAAFKITVIDRRTYNSSPKYGDESKMYASLRQVAYQSGQLIIQMHFSNRTESAEMVPAPSILKLTLNNGQVYELDGSNVTTPISVGPGLSDHYTYAFDLAAYPQLSGLDLSNAQVTLLPATSSSNIELAMTGFSTYVEDEGDPVPVTIMAAETDAGLPAGPAIITAT